MSNFYLEKTWKEKSDKEVFKAAENINKFSESIHPLIQSEVQRRRGLPFEAIATGASMPTEKQQANLKNPLSSWAWTFIMLNSFLAFLLISVGRYHWYFVTVQSPVSQQPWNEGAGSARSAACRA